MWRSIGKKVTSKTILRPPRRQRQSKIGFGTMWVHAIIEFSRTNLNNQNALECCKNNILEPLILIWVLLKVPFCQAKDKISTVTFWIAMCAWTHFNSLVYQVPTCSHATTRSAVLSNWTTGSQLCRYHVRALFFLFFLPTCQPYGVVRPYACVIWFMFLVLNILLIKITYCVALANTNKNHIEKRTSLELVVVVRICWFLNWIYRSSQLCSLLSVE